MKNDSNLISEEPVTEDNILNTNEEESSMDNNNGVKTDMSQTSPDVPSSPPAGQAAQTQMPTQANTQMPKLTTRAGSPYDVVSSDTYLVAGGGLDQDIHLFSSFANRSTGYKALDDIQPFYSGFYILAAAPGVGKTTAMLQLSYQLAASGTHAIFVSLEQTPLEIYSKAISRKSYMKYVTSNSTIPTYTSMDVRCNRVDPHTFNALRNECIQEVEDRLHIVQGNGTVDDICLEADYMIDQLNGSDVCIVIDYLQIISAPTVNGRPLDIKSNMDYTVSKLKEFQKKHNIPVVLISSLNRQSYMAPLTYDCCKESGNIEYTADVIWGLQYNILYRPEFYHHYDDHGKRGKETNVREKQAMLMDAQSSFFRGLNITYLKNRFGESGLTALFSYAPKFDAFFSADEKGYIIS